MKKIISFLYLFSSIYSLPALAADPSISTSMKASQKKQNTPVSKHNSLQSKESGINTDERGKSNGSSNIPNLLTLQQAQKFLQLVSPKLAAGRASVEAKEMQAKSISTMDHPMVFARTSASAYKVRKDIDLREAKQDLANSVNGAQPGILDGLNKLGIHIPNVPPLGGAIASKLPDDYAFSKSDQSISTGVGFVWPLYTAGRIDSLEGMLNSRTSESQADLELSKNELYTTLVDRYFNAQLAIIVAALRQDALNTIRQTDHMANRLYEEGFISLVDRMEAQTALANAESESTKARNNSRLAMMSLQSLLRTDYRIKPTTPLFISTKPLKKLSYYQEMALNNHPGLKVAKSKLEQAYKLHDLSDNQYKPSVSMFGFADIDKKPSWIAGVSATWTLTGGLDKSALLASSNSQIEQAKLSTVDLKDNLLLLVEKNWHDVKNAQARYEASKSNIGLSHKVLELRQLGMQEGINTAIDVVQAQTQYLKTSTEQALAVNDYVQALAKLMQSCGTPLDFNHYLENADVLLPQLYKTTDTSQKLEDK